MLSSSKIRAYLDKLIPFVLYRWIFFAFILFLFAFRVIYYHQWYIWMYTLGIYLLQLFILFLSPAFAPNVEQDTEEGMELPTSAGDEFRPFVRRLPEYKFWYSIY